MELKGSKTEKNLMTAFAGESQARNKYTYFASVAKKEGYEQIALLDGLTLLHEQGCDGLRIGGIDLLQVIRRHVAGLRALVREPAHKHGHGRDLDRVTAVSKVPQHAHDDRRDEQQADARNYDRFDTLFLMQGSHRPFCRLTGCRRGYN